MGTMPVAACLRFDIVAELFCPGLRQLTGRDEPVERRVFGNPGQNIVAESRHFSRQFESAARSFANPERDGRRCAVSVADDDFAAADVLDAPGRVAEEEDVAGIALDGEVFIERADDGAVLVVGDDAIARDFRDRPAAGDGREPRAFPRPQAAIDAVAMEIRPPAPARRRDPLAQHLEDVIVIGTRQVPVRIRPAEAFEECIFIPLLAGDRGDDLLRQDVQRRIGNVDAIESPFADGAHERGTFHQFFAGEREQSSLRHGAERVTGPADALQEGRDRPRRSKLADEVDVSDIDAEFQRRGCDHRLQASFLEPLLRALAGCCATGCRDATAPGPRRAVPSVDAPRAPPVLRWFTKTSVLRCDPISCTRCS